MKTRGGASKYFDKVSLSVSIKNISRRPQQKVNSETDMQLYAYRPTTADSGNYKLIIYEYFAKRQAIFLRHVAEKNMLERQISKTIFK